MPAPIRAGPLALCLALAAGPALAGGSAAAPLAVWSGNYGDHTSRAAQVAREPAAWRALWQRIGRTPPQALPDGGVAVAFLAGRQPTGGHRIVVDRQRRDTTLCLSWRVAPPQGAATQVLTRPWQVQLYRLPAAGLDRLALAGTAGCAAE